MRNISKSILAKFSSFVVFTYKDIALQFKGKIKSGNLRRIIAYLKKSGKIYSISKGSYSIKKDVAVSGFAFKPFYYGGLSALMIHELIDDQVKMDVITTRRVKVSETKVFGDPKYTVFLHHMPVKYFFGFDIIKYSGINAPVSDPEKTLIDLFYYKNRMPVQDYAEVLKKIKIRKLRSYLKIYDSHTRAAVLNFVKKYKKVADAGELDNPY